MPVSISRWYRDLQNKQVLFIGIGVSHTRLIEKFLEKEISVTVCDKRSPEQLGEDYERLSALGARFRLGEHYLDALQDADVIFRTPGMYYLSPALQEARKAGKVVTSEMECFCQLCPCKLYAITGSDGKTTTSTLIAKFLEKSGRTVHLGGNIGKALLPEIEEIGEDAAAVVELSSFQLLSMRCAPDVSVVKNVTPNHLDVHKDMEEYTNAKKNVYLHQNAFSRTVLNLDDPVTRSFAPEVRGELSWFSMKGQPEHGAFLDENGFLCFARHGKVEKLFHKDEILIRGMHNVENVLTAIAAVEGEVSLEDIREVVRTFGGVEHRIELVRTRRGVRWYNDSIASSPSRTMAGLRAFPEKVILIAGGKDKGVSYAPLGPVINDHVKAMVLCGATAGAIRRAAQEAENFQNIPILEAEDYPAAVAAADRLARPGDVVILSPASTSFDRFKNFEERGRVFKDLVLALPE